MSKSAPIKILHIWRDYSPSLFDQTHAICLKTEGFESYLLTNTLLDTSLSTCVNTRACCEKYTTSLYGQSFKQRLARLAERIGFWRKFSRVCLEEIERVRPDIIHLHFGTTAAMLMPYLATTKIPIAISFYGVDASMATSNAKWRERYIAHFGQASKIIILCEEVRKRLDGLGVIEPSRFVTWNLPANVERFSEMTRDPHAPIKNFLIAARFVAKKGYQFLLPAFTRLRERHPEVTLTIAGYGPRLERIRGEIAELGIAQAVRVTDTRGSIQFDDLMMRLCREADAFVLPSFRARDGEDEGGPALTLVKAQASGLPVVCTPFPGAEISVQHGQTGLFCESQSIESLEAEMEHIVTHPVLARQMGERGRKKVLEEFGIEAQSVRLERIYRSMLSLSSDVEL